MKLFSKLIALSLAMWTFMSVHAQTVYQDYQDGLVVFQLAPHARIIPSSEDKQVDFKQYDVFKSLNGVAIKEVKRLHPSVKDEKLKRTYQVELVNPTDVDHVVRQLNALDEILYAELKELHQRLLIPNDPRFGPANNQMWGLYRVNAPEAWDLTTGDANIKVAVTDDAFNVSHPDLVNKMLPGHDATTGGSDPTPCGANNGFHGSHVAGTVGAETDNNLGVASIGWDVSIIPVKIGRCSDGALTGGYEGVLWAADNGADVINMSWGGGGAGQYGQDVCNYAWNQGAILVAAAGNSNSTQQLYPAAYDNVIAVASTTTNDSKSNFSQYGTWVNISAPGSSILSTDQNNGYQMSQGTSMASPLVAGFMGLMKSYAPNATNADLVQCLYSGADNIDAQNPSYIGRLGEGRMNAYNSLLCAQQYAVDNDAAIAAILSPDPVVCGDSFTPEVELRNFGGNTLTSVTINYGWNGTNFTYDWTGSLGPGGTEVVTLPQQTVPDGSYTFTAATSMPNNQPDENPGNDESQLGFQVDVNGQFVEFTLELDCYGSDIDWEIRSDETGALVASGGNYTDNTGGQVISDSYCLPSGCYTFTINDSYGDGLNGSIYQGCSIDGDYRMTDELGNVLFEMTAPDGDFGDQAVHNFCIVAQDNENDAGITSIVSPSGYICNETFEPTVRLRNFGIETLTSVDIHYRVNGGAEEVFSWTGSLPTGQATNVELGVLTAQNGSAEITAYTSMPNGEEDDNEANDEAQATVSILSEVEQLPFVEDFEADVFTNGRWIIDNPDEAITWELATVGGTTPGSTAAKMNFFGYGQTGERDRMISPLISLDGYINASMSFEHAYRRFDQTAADSLVVYISTDCGENLTRVFGTAEDGTGTFATQITSEQEFVPSSEEDWCFGGDIGADCFEVNLDAFIGQEIIVIFESYNGGQIGNNLYIDNINIDGEKEEEEEEEELELVAEFESDKTELCEGGGVNFTDLSKEEITSWSWTFDGGTPATSNDQNPSVTYTMPGTYSVSLEVTNADGTITETKTDYITVYANPSEPQIAQNGGILSVGLLPGETAEWFSGTTSIGVGESIEVTESGVYSVIVTNENECTSENDTTVEIEDEEEEELPEPDFEADVTSVCAGETVTYTDLSTGGVTSWSWTFEGGVPATSTDPNPVVTYPNAGNYSVTLEVTNADGTTSLVETGYITVNALPNLSVTSTNMHVCEGNSTVLVASGANTYEWSDNLGTGAEKEVTPTETITYTVVGENQQGCSDEATITITVIDKPSVTIEVDEDELCVGESVTLSASGAENYVWDNGLGAGQSHTVSPVVTTVYTVTASNGGVCAETTSITVNVLSAPSLTVSASEFTICEGESTVLSANGGGSYTWSPGSSLDVDNQASVTATPVETTTYEVTSANKCGSDTESLTINVVDLPSVSVIVQDGDELSVEVDPSKTVTWYFDGAIVGTGSTHTMTQDGEYTVVVSNENGCSDSVTEEFESTASIADFDLVNNVVLYPNPTSGAFKIALTNLTEVVDITIIDALGKQVIQPIQTTNYSKEEVIVDLSHVETGVYFVVFATPNSMFTKKITVRN